MTNNSSISDSLAEQIRKAPANVTVFSDGSTFSYEHGYKSNGAPVATRDRTDVPRIVKSYKVFTPWVVNAILVIGVVCFAAGFEAEISSLQAEAQTIQQHADKNKTAFKDAVENSGQQVKVIDMSNASVLVQRPDGSTFKCSVSFVSNHGHPTGYGFCSPGGPATFTVPLPYDPDHLVP